MSSEVQNSTRVFPPFLTELWGDRLLMCVREKNLVWKLRHFFTVSPVDERHTNTYMGTQLISILKKKVLIFGQKDRLQKL